MARRGSFGRSPRPAASLTNTIIAIAREMQSQRDQNIVDAWQKGGMFEGHKVTDEMILAHWKKRSQDVSKDDPLYDTYNNAYMEYDYSINESKMRTGYAQGKISDSAAAAFYLNWSKKVPKNSEFWRVLQRDAAEFTRAAKAKSDAERNKQLEIKYQADLKAINDRDVAPGNFIQDLFKNLAKRGLRPGGGDPLIDPLSGELYQFTADDVPEMLAMINNLTDTEDPIHGKKGTVTSPTNDVIYHDDNGQPVTGAQIVAQFKKIAPGFKGNLTLDNLNDYVTQQHAGLIKQAELAEKTGHLTDAKKFRDQATEVAEVGREIKAWPAERNYLIARDAKMRVLNNPASSAQDILDAKAAFAKAADNILKDPSIQSNDVFINKLRGEVNGDEGTTTLAEDFTGLNQSADHTEKMTDIQKENIYVQRAQAGIDAVSAGKAVWTTGEYDKQTREFIPSPGGSSIGAATPQDIANHSGGIPTQTVYVPDAGGRYTPVAMMGQPVTIHAIGKDGKEIPITKGANSTVATIYVGPDGKQLVKFSDGKGHDLWSDVGKPPWGKSASLTESSTGFDLTVQSPQNEGEVAALGFKFEVNSDGQRILTYDPQSAMLASDPDHGKLIKAGVGDPHTDFRSANIAYFNSTPDGQERLYQLRNNPGFRKQLEIDTHLSAGFTPAGIDASGNIQWNADGDAKALDNGTKQATGWVDPNLSDKWSNAEFLLHDRTTPASDLAPDARYESDTPLPNSVIGNVPGFGNQAHSFGMINGLASGKLSGTPFESMTGHLQSGTLTPNPNYNDHGSSGINDIKIGGNSIKVPNAPQFGYAGPAPVSTPSVASTPSATLFGGGLVNPSITASENGSNPLARIKPVAS